MRKGCRQALITLATLVGLSLVVYCDTIGGPTHLLPQPVRRWVYLTLLPKPPLPHWTLYHETKTADEVQIERIDGNGVPPLPRLDHEHDPAMLKLLHNSHQFHSSPPHAKPELILDIEKSDGKYNESETGPTPFPMYQYVIETGELGQDHEWCYVPQEFREWMKTVVDSTPEVQIGLDGRMKAPKAVPFGPQKS